ncbi:FMN-binding protein [Helcococcus kunzii]|uniref:FMN-binding domain-containing protein n=1 Tax=Helcococcus kunzii ATCC 51366 TaxID=883114 RepID=H3NNX9_9FIRM|nr:FMN-binding protein [Helcococcus kunzii]EHR34104.1 hypothetical protein HMPREF9709_01040 [Helcococcus kunzii ATCC 51366]MCT1795713.1 FMN-binding protein [Helcococcus kunzii]MCT1988674.1 FMN-binding protein [Helcococcus kunzii]
MKKLLSMALAAVLVFSLVGCGNNANDTKGEAKTEAKVLKGEADGYKGKVTVEVTKDGDKITDLKIEGKDETPEIGQEAIKTLSKTITEKGTTEGIEAVSGATVTSEAVFKAIKEAK